jgi:hypothetical protein
LGEISKSIEARLISNFIYLIEQIIVEAQRGAARRSAAQNSN